jgi:ribosomal protein S18 acetylase RimI-like enzyme
MMEITVRRAQPEDVPAIVGLIRELAAASNESSPITETYAAQYLSSPGSSILLAESDGQVVGLLSYSVRPDLYHAASSCLIEDLVVRTGMRGRGVGSRLLAELMARLPETGCAEVSVTTLPGNAPALKFYRKHGLVDEAVFLERHLDR